MKVKLYKVGNIINGFYMTRTILEDMVEKSEGKKIPIFGQLPDDVRDVNNIKNNIVGYGTLSMDGEYVVADVELQLIMPVAQLYDGLSKGKPYEDSVSTSMMYLENKDVELGDQDKELYIILEKS